MSGTPGHPRAGAGGEDPPEGLADRVAELLIALLSRCARVWRALSGERRLAGGAAVLLILTLFLPWYQVTAIAAGRHGGPQALSQNVTGWGVFSGIEALLLLLALGVLALLFRVAEGRLRVPGGDGWPLLLAGALACLLVLVRIFDKPSSGSHGRYAATSGIDWGILAALAAAALLTYAAWRIRGAGGDPPLAPAAPARTPGPAPSRSPDPGRASAPAPAPAPVPARPARAPRPHPAASGARPPRPRPAASGGPPRPRSAASAPEPESVDPAPTPATRLLRTIGRRELTERPAGWLSAPPSNPRRPRPPNPGASGFEEPDDAG